VLTWINPLLHSPCAASFWIRSQSALRKILCGEGEGFPPTAQSASLRRFRLKDTHTTQFNLQPKKKLPPNSVTKSNEKSFCRKKNIQLNLKSLYLKDVPCSTVRIIFFIIIILSGVRLSPLDTAATNWTTVTAPGSNPRRRCGNPAANRLSYGAANTVRK
jgi:hypothetical protein